MKGLITKGIAGFYYVKTDRGVFQCKARGIFKKEGITPCVGDYVEMDVTDKDDDEGIINKILPRKNIFIRPPISNIDLFVIVIATEDPEPNTEIIDKFLVTAELAEVNVLICINKEDLVEDADPVIYGRTEKLLEIYGHLYHTILISAKTGTGLDSLKDQMKGQKSALIGPSGVGKSTIINSLEQGLSLETGNISRKTKRGKHTTRHVEIFDTDFGAQIYDTPGFTSFEVKREDDVGLEYLFPEFRPYMNKCKFYNCKHMEEPGCSIKQAVEDGIISKSRYDSYKRIGEEWNG